MRRKPDTQLHNDVPWVQPPKQHIQLCNPFPNSNVRINASNWNVLKKTCTLKFQLRRTVEITPQRHGMLQGTNCSRPLRADARFNPFAGLNYSAISSQEIRIWLGKIARIILRAITTLLNVDGSRRATMVKKRRSLWLLLSFLCHAVAYLLQRSSLKHEFVISCYLLCLSSQKTS